MEKCLLIIDIQNFYFGKDGLENNIEASLKAKELLEHFRSKDWMVIHIKHSSKDDIGVVAELHENVKPIDGEMIILKKTPGSFKDTNLHVVLKEKGITELYICGMMSHMCVDTTTREAFDLGYNCTVLHDACATRALTFNGRTVAASDVHTTAMAALQFAFAKVISVEAAVKES